MIEFGGLIVGPQSFGSGFAENTARTFPGIMRLIVHRVAKMRQPVAKTLHDVGKPFGPDQDEDQGEDQDQFRSTQRRAEHETI